MKNNVSFVYSNCTKALYLGIEYINMSGCCICEQLFSYGIGIFLLEFFMELLLVF